MGFDQYHEPPEELSDETRTFARLCASLTEEAEAIGWYEQRIAVESDRQARAIMRRRPGRGVQALLHGPRVPAAARPPLARDRRGHPVPGGRHRRARRGGRGAGRGGRRGARSAAGRQHIARHRQPEGGRVMSHLLREHAPITEAGWSLIDDEARERLTPALAARKLVDFAGPHGWEHSATNLGRIERARRCAGGRREAAQRRVLRAGGAARAVHARAQRVARRRPRRRRCGPRAARRGRPPHRHGGEPRRVPRLGGRRHHGHRGGRDPRGDHARRRLRALPGPRGPGRRGAAARRHRRPLRPRARTRGLHPGARDRPSTAATRCSTTCARSSAGRCVGAGRGRRGGREPGRRPLPVRSRRGSLDRL